MSNGRREGEAHKDSREVASGEDEEGAADEERGAGLATFEVDRLASCVAALVVPPTHTRALPNQYGERRCCGDD